MKRYLLYIDILGFSRLVTDFPDKVSEIYAILDSLHVHSHSVFTTIVFSDTVLVYNNTAPASQHDHHYLVMYSCEFAQDLMYRCIGKDIYFRAFLTIGNFDHYNLKNLQCFYGQALINAYHAEKHIIGTGLFMDEKCRRYSDIFKTTRYDEDIYFVYLNRHLDTIDMYMEDGFPIDEFTIDRNDLGYFIIQEVGILKDIHSKMTSHPDPKVRIKHLTTWQFLRMRHGRFVDSIEEAGFDLSVINANIDWSKYYQSR